MCKPSFPPPTNEPSIEEIRGDETLEDKLHPSRFTAMSPKMAAIVAFILGESWTEPDILSLSITSDGCVVSDRCFIGSMEDFSRNISALIQAAELTKDEETEFRRRMHKIDDHRLQA